MSALPPSAERAENSGVRLWCVAARDAPIVAAFARVHGESGSTGVLRWNWHTAKVEVGAWTRLRLATHRCALSPDGEFLLYHATGGDESPFPGRFGGAFAISRLPYLAALTNTQTFGPAGGGVSRDALSEPEQQRLWDIFDGAPFYVRDEHWPTHLGHAWHTAPPEDQAALEPHAGRIHLAASAEIPDAALRVHAVVRSHTDRWGGHHWSIWNDDLRFFMAPAGGVTGEPRELPRVRWACPAGGGRLLLATDDAKLLVLRHPHKTGASMAHEVEQEHDLSGLTPCPGPAPDWAKAGLTRE